MTNPTPLESDSLEDKQLQTKLVGTDEFCVKRGLFVYKLLPFTANSPPPPTAILVAVRRHTCQLIYDIFISFQHCNGGGGWGDHNSKFSPKYKVYHELCPGLRLGEPVNL